MSLTGQKENRFHLLVESYRPLAEAYFKKEWVVSPDPGDMAQYIYDLMKEDGVNVNAGDYWDMFQYLGGKVEP
jgi:hypothetical protein